MKPFSKDKMFGFIRVCYGDEYGWSPCKSRSLLPLASNRKLVTCRYCRTWLHSELLEIRKVTIRNRKRNVGCHTESVAAPTCSDSEHTISEQLLPGEPHTGDPVDCDEWELNQRCRKKDVSRKQLHELRRLLSLNITPCFLTKVTP